MSIVTSILNIARDQAAQVHAQVIQAIEVEVGAPAGIEIPALEFCFQAARAQTIGEQAELIIREVPGVGHCSACDTDSEMDFYAAVCLACNKAVLEVRQGREMRVLSIRVDYSSQFPEEFIPLRSVTDCWSTIGPRLQSILKGLMMRCVRTIQSTLVLVFLSLFAAAGYSASQASVDQLATDHLAGKSVLPPPTQIITVDTAWSGNVSLGRVRVDNGATLTIAAGAVVTAQALDSYIEVVDGFVWVQGTTTQPVEFDVDPSEVAELWWGMLINADSSQAGVLLKGANVRNALFGLAPAGVGSFAIAENSSFFGCYHPCSKASDGEAYLRLTRCKLDNRWGPWSGSGILGDGLATDCELYECSLKIGGGKIESSMAYGCDVGFMGWGEFVDSAASGCTTGYNIQGSIVDVGPVGTTLTNCEATRCDTGFFLRQSVNCYGIRAHGSAIVNIKIDVSGLRPDYAPVAEIHDSMVLGSAGNIGIMTTTNSRGQVFVYDSVITGHGTNIECNHRTVDYEAGIVLGENGSGNNSIIRTDPLSIDIANNSGIEIMAENCFWYPMSLGEPDPIISGYSVDYDPWLTAMPNHGLDGVVPATHHSLQLTAGPNPFNPQTTIRFALDRSQDVSLVVFDVAGRAVRTLHSGVLDAGPQAMVWNGKDSRGSAVATGTYFAQVRTADGVQTQKLLLIK